MEIQNSEHTSFSLIFTVDENIGIYQQFMQASQQ